MRPTSNDVVPGTRILVLPLGSWEQHGPHLPLDTDSRIVSAIVDAAMGGLDPGEYLVAPTLPITASDEHAGFAGTLSAGTDATATVVAAISRSATWARGVCLVNGHGGNADALRMVVAVLSGEGVNHCVWHPPMEPGDDMHAGRTETSLMLHLDPVAVRRDRIVAGTEPRAGAMEVMRAGGVAALSPNGVIGDPRGASGAEGARLLDRYARSLAARLAACARDWPATPT